MMGRPKKNLDINLILKMHGEGKSIRDIARLSGTSKSTIFRVLGQCPKSVPVPSVVTCKSVEQKPEKPVSDVPPARALSTNNSGPFVPATTIPALSAHRQAFSLPYVGKQPISEDKNKLRNSFYFKFEIEGGSIIAHTKRVLIWINEAKGETPDEIKDRTQGRAKRLLAEFAHQYGLTLDWSKFERQTDPHFVVEGSDINDVLMTIFEGQRGEAKKIGAKPGDHSHKDKFEFEDGTMAKRLVDLIAKTPEEWEAERQKIDFCLTSLQTLIRASMDQAQATETHRTHNLAQIGAITLLLDKSIKRQIEFEETTNTKLMLVAQALEELTNKPNHLIKLN